MLKNAMIKNKLTLKYFNDNETTNTLWGIESEKNKSKLFINHNNDYWVTKQDSFGRILEIITIELKIIDIKYLQPQKDINNQEKIIKERNKLKILAQAKIIGERLLSDNKEFFINKETTELGDLLKKNFYILKNQTDNFIIKILTPLLQLIENGEYYKWEKLEDKSGYWRELKEKDLVPIGSEVSMNFKTGKNMLKL